MALIFITGASTAGKSSIARELTKRGYEAYDTEQNDMSAWYNKATGERVAGFMQAPERTKGWYRQHAWNISIPKVIEIGQHAKDKPVFLCGGSHNHEDVVALCDKVFWLVNDEATIMKRIALPREHDWGSSPDEIAMTLETNKRLEKRYRDIGAIMIDATQPLSKVTDVILARIS